METAYSLSDIAALNGGEGFGGANAWVLIILFALIFGNGGFGGWGNNSQAASSADIQRAVDLNAIQQGQAGIAADVQRGIYEINGATKDAAYNNLGEIRDVGAAVATSGANIINNLTAMQAQMQNCCCETKSAIMENRYLDAQNTASINANTTAQTQKVLDAIAQNKIDTLQSQLSNVQNQLALQQAMCGVPKINPYMYGIVPAYGGCGCNNSI